MSTYYIIDSENRLIDELESSTDEEAVEDFKNWLRESTKLEEYLLVKKIYFGKLVISTEPVLR